MATLVEDESSNNGPAVGMCRFDLADDSASAEVSINLNPRFRGQGLAGPILRAAIERFHSDNRTAQRLTATVRMNNSASAKLFTSAGFLETSTDSAFSYVEADERSLRQ